MVNARSGSELALHVSTVEGFSLNRNPKPQQTGCEPIKKELSTLFGVSWHYYLLVPGREYGNLIPIYLHIV